MVKVVEGVFVVERASVVETQDGRIPTRKERSKALSAKGSNKIRTYAN